MTVRPENTNRTDTGATNRKGYPNRSFRQKMAAIAIAIANS